MKKANWTELTVRVILLLAGLTVAHLGVTLFLESDLGSDPFNVLVQGLFRALPWPAWMTHGRVHLLVCLLIVLVLLAVAHLGVTLFLESDLGSDPFNVLVQGLYRRLPWPGWMTHGRVHLLVCLLIVAALLVIARSYVRIGTVLCMALGGPIIDLWTLPLAPLFPEELALPWRLLALVAGCVILAFGMTVVIRSEAGTGPNDLVAVVLSDKIKKPFGPVRVGVDVLFALAGWLLGGVVGLGTVVCACLVGPCAQVFLPISGRLCDTCLNKIRGDTP